MPSPPSSGGIASLFHHVDLALSRYHRDTRGPYTGDHVILDDSDGILCSSWSGFALQATVIPPEWGRKLWFNGIALGEDWSEDAYAPPWGYLTFVGTNVFGFNFVYQRETLQHAVEPFYYEEAVPQALLLHAEPGWSVDVYAIRI